MRIREARIFPAVGLVVSSRVSIPSRFELLPTLIR